jgi:hypothetical protein
MFVFQSEGKDASGVGHVQIGLFLRMGAPVNLFKKRGYSRCAFYNDLSSPA